MHTCTHVHTHIRELVFRERSEEGVGEVNGTGTEEAESLASDSVLLGPPLCPQLRESSSLPAPTSASSISKAAAIAESREGEGAMPMIRLGGDQGDPI